MMRPEQTAAVQQDALRPVRNFVSLLSGAVGDQTFAETDGMVYGPTGQFGVQGPNGVSIEGKPVMVATTAPPAGVGGGIQPLYIIGGALLLWLALS